MLYYTYLNYCSLPLRALPSAQVFTDLLFSITSILDSTIVSISEFFTYNTPYWLCICKTDYYVVMGTAKNRHRPSGRSGAQREVI